MCFGKLGTYIKGKRVVDLVHSRNSKYLRIWVNSLTKSVFRSVSNRERRRRRRRIGLLRTLVFMFQNNSPSVNLPSWIVTVNCLQKFIDQRDDSTYWSEVLSINASSMLKTLPKNGYGFPVWTSQLLHATRDTKKEISWRTSSLRDTKKAMPKLCCKKAPHDFISKEVILPSDWAIGAHPHRHMWAYLSTYLRRKLVFSLDHRWFFSTYVGVYAAL